MFNDSETIIIHSVSHKSDGAIFNEIKKKFASNECFQTITLPCSDFSKEMVVIRRRYRKEDINFTAGLRLIPTS